MENVIKTSKVTLWVNRMIALVLIITACIIPFGRFHIFEPSEWTALRAAFYPCALVTAVALWNMDRLLMNILKEEVFTWDNVNRIRNVRWCCFAVSLICIPATVFFLPLILMVIIMAFLSLVVNVVCQVMKAAVVIREENDLTI